MPIAGGLQDQLLIIAREIGLGILAAESEPAQILDMYLLGGRQVLGSGATGKNEYN